MRFASRKSGPFARLELIDADSHIAEADDLSTYRAPAKSAYRRPQTDTFGAFWFDGARPRALIHLIGAGEVLWTIVLPHPTNLHQSSLGRSKKQFNKLDPGTIHKTMPDNAAKLYKIEV